MRGFPDVHASNENMGKTTRHKKARHKVQPVVQQAVEPDQDSVSQDEESQLSEQTWEHNVVFQSPPPMKQDAPMKPTESKRMRKQGNSPQRMKEELKETEKKKRVEHTRNKVQSILTHQVEKEPDSPESRASELSVEVESQYQEDQKHQSNSPRRMHSSGAAKPIFAGGNELINRGGVGREQPTPPMYISQLNQLKKQTKSRPEKQLSLDLSNRSDPNKQFSFDLSQCSTRDSLQNNEQLKDLLKLLQKEGMVGGISPPKRSANEIMQSAHQTIKKKREEVQALDTPCLDHYCEQLCWTTQYIFSISTIVLLIFYGSFDHPAPFVNTFLVQSIASIAYFVKASHVGEMKIGDTPVPFVRYVDWITTTPLMLYELCHIAHAESHVVVMVIGCDLITLGLGISSAVIDQEHHFGVKYTLFAIAAAFYILMVCTLVMDVAHPLYDAAKAHHDDDHYIAADDHADSNIEETVILFDNLETLMIVTWSFYPIAVLLGRAHFGIITQSVEDGFICILDILSKIGMEGMIIAYAVQHYQGSSGDDDGH